MHTFSFAAHSVAEIDSQLAQLKKEGHAFSLAIVFISSNFDLSATVEIFNQHRIALVGCTTAGEIEGSKVYENAAVCLLMHLNTDSFQTFAAAHLDNPVYQTAFSLGLEAKHTFKNPAVLLLSGGIQVDAERIVQGVKDGVGREIPFFGGLAGDNLLLQETHVFSNDLISNHGLVGLIFDNDKIDIRGMASSGWQSIGGENIITAAEGNIVMGINHRPALDVFLQYFGFFDNTYHNGEVVSSLSAQYPLQIMREGGYTVLRSPLFADFEKRTLTLAAGVETGQKFRFSIAPGFEVVEQTVQEFSTLKNDFPKADAVILFSCKGRHSAFGPMIEDEIEGLYQHWRAPMIGFFSYGEIGNTPSGVCEFHNETCSLVLIRQK